MKSQKYNQGALKELNVEIEAEIVDCFEEMAQNTGINLADLIVIALKRFKTSHGDYRGKTPIID